MEYLTEVEKEKMAMWLSKRATAGGWFFMSMIGFILLMVLFAISPANKNRGSYSSDDVGILITLIMIMGGVRIWLLRRRAHIRRLLDESLVLGNGRILNQYRVPYTGFRLKLQITMPEGNKYETHMEYLGLPDWQIGDEIELIF